MDIDILLILQGFRNGVGACLVDFMTKMSFIGEMKFAVRSSPVLSRRSTCRSFFRCV